MYVERLSWVVPRELKESSLNLLSVLHHHMDGSGGLIRALAGWDAKSEGHLLSLTFWRDWESLTRFLSGDKASLLAESSSGHSVERPKPQHFEVVWEWPQEEADTRYGEWYWAIHDFLVDSGKVEDLLDELRRLTPAISHGDGFVTAGLWLDRSDPNHVVLASQWSSQAPPDMEAQPDWLRNSKAHQACLAEHRLGLYRVRAFDPLHIAVP